jgi:RNA polymerase sigma-70 factor (ECF subfamily)
LNKRGQPVTKPVSNRAIHIIKHPVRTASLSWYRTPRLSWYINAEAAEALDDDEPSGKHSHCIVCGRPLTDPESQARGYGPTCAGDYNHMFIEAVDEGLQKDLMTQAMRQMRNKQKAEDLFQETMVKAFRFYPSFKVPSGKEPRAALKNWLFRTMTNTLINDDRREKRGPKMTPVDELTDRTLADEEGYATDTRPRSAEDEYLKRITDSRLRDAFDAIPEQFREPVYLADIEGVPYKEIAEMMGIPPGTVMSRIKRGRDKLREILAPQATGRGFNVARRLSWYRSPWYRYADLGLVTPSLAPISGGSGIGFGTSAGDAKPGEHENSWGLKPYSQMGGPTGTGGGGGGGGASSSGGGGAPANYSPGAGVEQWRDEVLLGLQRNGLPSTLADQVLHQMETESSGNPRAINNWDSNAQKGTPSKGLLQTIDPTFKQYKLPGDADDPYDPQANVDAAINYSKSRYGPTLMNNGQGMGSGTGY